MCNTHKRAYQSSTKAEIQTQPLICTVREEREVRRFLQDESHIWCNGGARKHNGMQIEAVLKGSVPLKYPQADGTFLLQRILELARND